MIKEKPYRSGETVAGAERSGNRGYLYALGLGPEDLEKPFIGIVNSWSGIHPGHVHLRELAAAVSEGVLAAGGRPFEFNTIAICDVWSSWPAVTRSCRLWPERQAG